MRENHFVSMTYGRMAMNLSACSKVATVSIAIEGTVNLSSSERRDHIGTNAQLVQIISPPLHHFPPCR